MNRFYDTLSALAVVLTPAAMIVALGWSTYTAILAETGVTALAVLSGVATAAAVECVGIVAGETVLWFHARHDRRWLTAAAILALYVIFGVVILRSTALMLLPVLAAAVYVLVGLRAQAARETAAENGHAAENAAWQREQWRIKQSDRTRIKLAQSQHRASIEPAPAALMPIMSGHSANGVPVMPAPSEHQCQHCGRGFASAQALNAHKRFCKRKTAPAAANPNGDNQND